ncbi:hypothetical protein Ancab_038158 [Ancistrocladus abbreviatus]
MTRPLGDEEKMAAQSCILLNCVEVEPYINDINDDLGPLNDPNGAFEVIDGDSNKVEGGNELYVDFVPSAGARDERDEEIDLTNLE